MKAIELQIDTHNTERLGVTAFISLVAHIVVILGVGFTLPKIASQPELSNTLEILLVNAPNYQEAEDADFIAQHDSLGGGDAETVAQSPLPFEPDTQDSATSSASPQQQNDSPSPDIQTIDGLQFSTPSESVETTAPPSVVEPTEESPTDNTAAIATAERRRLIAQISQRWQEYQKKPRRTFLSPSVKSDAAANYMAMWREQVESVGNANYPAQARQQQISAELIVDVAINPDGSINEVNLVKRSAYPFLNDAAIRFIELASPFAAFPEELKATSDIIHITRSFHFLEGELNTRAVDRAN
ncbi:MAG: energy transducer TonB [Proteobacteria bacterium]|nr:energy transducer TonB [Pseudomonadota bacterium]